MEADILLWTHRQAAPALAGWALGIALSLGADRWLGGAGGGTGRRGQVP
jgi:hypothetical protein